MGKLTLSLTPIVQRRVAQVLLGLAALFLVDAVYQVGTHLWWKVWISRQTRALQATSAPATQPAGKDRAARPPELAADIRKRNIFTAPKPKGHGLTLTGVIFDRALFNRREGGTMTLKEGESGGGIKVKSIDGYEVVIEYEGQPQTMRLFSDQGGGPGMPPGGPPGGPGPVMAGPPNMPAAIRMEGGSMPTGVDLSNLPPEVREKLESRMRRRGR